MLLNNLDQKGAESWHPPPCWADRRENRICFPGRKELSLVSGEEPAGDVSKIVS